ncbi:MAG: AAA family ATPase [Candidatus Woesearchaeota archaeon]|jgi:guanylate kinase|nr:AAA family ATPase [Candidatus Woesearchaeota archaeon]
MKKKDIIVLCGASASGKDSIARKLEKGIYNFIVSTSTRPMRAGESENNPYHFINNSEFLNMIHNDELIEYREYNTLVENKPATWYYGVAKKDIDSSKSYVVVLDIVGLKEFKEYFGDRVLPFFIEASEETRKQRCILRGDYDETEFNRRLEDDRKVFFQETIDKEINFRVQSTNIDENVEYILDKISCINNFCN